MNTKLKILKKGSSSLLLLLLFCCSHLQAQGNALNFDGNNDYVKVNNTIGNFRTSAFTIETWVRTTATTGTIIGKRNANSYGNFFVVGLTAGKLYMEINGTNSSDYTITTSPAAINDGRWHHIAAERGTNAKLYLIIDGIAVTETTINGNPDINNTVDTTIGRILDGTTPILHFNGTLDQMRIWNVGRTDVQVRTNMFNTITSETGLSASYNFNAGTASGTNTGITTLPDQTANANNGTMGTYLVFPSFVGTFALTGTTSNWVESYAMVVPTASAATGIGSAAFTANWTAPAVGTVTNYLLDVSTSSTFASVITGSPFTVASGTTSKAITGLSTSTTYYYRVRADKTSVTGQGGYSSTITTATTTMVPPGNALNFSTSSSISFTNPFSTLTDNFTLETWVNWNGQTTTQNSGYCIVLINGNAVSPFSGYGFQLNTNNGKIGYFMSGIDGRDCSAITPGKWYHLALVRKNGVATLFVNGVPDSNTTSTSPNIPATSAKIGLYGFAGNIDEVRMWNVAKTQAQIQAAMFSPLQGNDANLRSYYNFDDGIAGGTNTGITNLADRTSNGNNGTLTNFALSGTTSNWVESYAMVVPTAGEATAATSSSFTVNWTAPTVGTVTNYLIHVSTSSTFNSYVPGTPFSAAAGTTSKVITGFLTSGTTYYYRVLAEKTSVTQQGGYSATKTVCTTSTATAGFPIITACVGSSFISSTHSTTGATGIGSASGLPAGVTASWSNDTITIQGLLTVSGTFNYNIPLIVTCGSAVNATGTIIVNPKVTPTFTQVNPICYGSAPSFLPETSNNGITGYWLPVWNSLATTTYDFTQDGGQCATSTLMTITVNPKVTPTFTQVSAICSGATLSALPTTSTNAITGTWSPALNNTATTTYTFKPTAGLCANTTAMTITVNPNITPTFTAVAPICSGATLSALPTTSTNAITGTWLPALNNTATTTYTFTPTAGLCANTTAMIITVTPSTENVTNASACGSYTWSNNGQTYTASGTYTGTSTNCLIQKLNLTIVDPAAGFSSGGINYVVTSISTVAVGANPNASGVVDIPSSVTTACGSYAVTSINNNAFYNCSCLTSVTIPNSVTSVGNDAFKYCVALTSVTIPNSVTSIGTSTFSNCKALTSVIIPNSVTSIGQGTFEYCRALISVTIPNSVTSIGFEAFSDCSSLTSVTIPNSVTSIGGGAFSYCPSLTTATIPNSVIEIKYYTFYNCTGLTTVTIPNSVTSIGWRAFYNCSGLTSVICNINTPIDILGQDVFAGVNQGACSLTVPVGTVTAYQAAAVWQNFNPIMNPPIVPVASSLHFSASANTVNLGPTLGNFGTGDFAIEMKVKTSGSPYGHTYLLDKRSFCDRDNLLDIAITPQGSIIVQTFSNQDPFSYVTGSVIVTDNSWHQIAVTRTSGYLKIYVDGVLDATSATNAAVNFNSNYKLVLGGNTPCTPYNNNQYFSGNMDEVRFWNRSLCQTEIQNNMNCEVLTTGNGLLANYHFNQGNVNTNNTSVTTLIDSSGNNNNGTLAYFGLSGTTSNWSSDAAVPSGVACSPFANVATTIPAFTQVSAICAGATLSGLPTTSNNNIVGTWSPELNNSTTTTYLFTPNAGQCATTAIMTITVNPATLTPTFTQVPTICSGASVAELPTTSLDGITGTWSPAINNLETTTYTFTRADGLCGTANMEVIVNTPKTPEFNQIGAICASDYNEVLNQLPTTSLNGIAGTWQQYYNWNYYSNNQVFYFTPSAGQCATTAQMNIDVQIKSNPSFNINYEFCQGSTFTLPNTSLEGIQGTWSLAFDSYAVGTRNYTFTPNSNYCANVMTISITVNPLIQPDFSYYIPSSRCPGEQFYLPTTSNNGITGVWGNIGDNFTFVPNPGQCASDITYYVQTLYYPFATFDEIAPICAGNTLTLPSRSREGYDGYWSPSEVNNQSSAYYYFSGSATCGNGNGSVYVQVNPSYTPTFNEVAPICTGATLSALPTTSNEGIIGTWSPALNNLATTTYAFTPNAGQCAVAAVMTITVNPKETLTFTQVSAICSGASLDALPTASNEGFTGTWSPAFNNLATTMYTFTPNVGQCATTATMIVTVNPLAKPTFTQVPPICYGASVAELPTTSLNGIAGTWSPAMNNLETTTYTFTRADGLCGTASMEVIVNAPVTPEFNQIESVCVHDYSEVVNLLPTTSLNGIAGTWQSNAFFDLYGGNVRLYHFSPNAGQCANNFDMVIKILFRQGLSFDSETICQYSTFSLPESWGDVIPGTWSPAFDSTQIGTRNYTFTPNSNYCAEISTMSITVNARVQPIFSSIQPYRCDDLDVTTFINYYLPLQSDNGIWGS